MASPDSHHTPPCSVVVCTRGRPAALERCLGSIADLDHVPYETIVVDNSSGDRVAERIAAASAATYLSEPRQGLSRARNLGADVARGELIAYLDDDSVAGRSWLGRHVEAMSDPTVAVTTGRILAPADEWSFFDLGASGAKVDLNTPGWFEMANFGGLGFGGNMVLRRELFDAGFRFRESLGAGTPMGGGEEMYAFFTIIRAGHAIAYVPEATVIHPTSASERSVEAIGARRHGAYIALLLAEERGFRGRTVRHVLEAVRRRPRAWRRVAPERRALPRWAALAAASAGPVAYVQSRLTGAAR